MLVTRRSFSTSGWAQLPETPLTPVVLTYSANHRRLQSHSKLELFRWSLERCFRWDTGDSWMVLITLSLRSRVSRLSSPMRAKFPTLLILFPDNPNTLSLVRCLNGACVSSMVWESWLLSRWSSSRRGTSANVSLASMWDIRLSFRFRNFKLGSLRRILRSTISSWLPYKYSYLKFYLEFLFFIDTCKFRL